MAPTAASARVGPASALPKPSPRQRVQAWWLARLPLTDSVSLGQRNIYILPTRAGLAFAATLALMLLAAINYQLNLGFALTFLLFGVGVVSMHLTHGTLRGLSLHLRPTLAVFAGQAAVLDIVITNPGRLRHGLGLHLLHEPLHHAPLGAANIWCDVPAQGQEIARISTVPTHRGWHAVPTVVVETVFPFGLFRAWTLWRPAARVLAWPQPEPAAPPLPVAASSQGDEQRSRRGPGGELDGVRPWRRGDTMRQVVWKKVARSGELVSRETTAAGQRELWLDWAQTPGQPVEQRLSRLAAWVLLAEQQGLACGLRLPGLELQPGQGDAHRRAALDQLALWA